MKFICFFVILYFASAMAMAGELECELTFNHHSVKASDPKSVTVQLEPYTCRAVLNSKDTIHMRITSTIDSDKVDESGYRFVNETLYNLATSNSGLDYATCNCTLK